MKRVGYVYSVLAACACLIFFQAQAAAQPDEVFYFHDAGNGIWDNDWYGGADQCFGGAGQWMDAEPPTGVGFEHYLMPQPIRCHLDLPGCLSTTIPFGTWYLNLYLKGTPAKLWGYLYAEDCDVLCSSTRYITTFDGAFSGSPEYMLVKTPAKADSIVLSGERLLVEVIAIPPNSALMIWDDATYPSGVTAPGPVATEPALWGRVKSLYR